MLETQLACLQQTSIFFDTVGNAIMMFVCSRGVDTAARPSFFFYELTLARILLGICWSISHSLISFVNSGSVDHDLLIANLSLDVLHALVHIVQLLFHRYWCMNKGWSQLRRRSALQSLHSLLLFSVAFASFSTVLGNAFLYHTPSTPQYSLNIVAQVAFGVISWMVLYLLRYRMHRGQVWLIVLLVSVASAICYAVALCIQHFVFHVPMWFDDEYGYIYLSILWAICACFALFCHLDKSFARLQRGPGSADPTPVHNATVVPLGVFPVPSITSISSELSEISDSAAATPSIHECLPQPSTSTTIELFPHSDASPHNSVEPPRSHSLVESHSSLNSTVIPLEIKPLEPGAFQETTSTELSIVEVPDVPVAISMFANPVLLMMHKVVLFAIESLLFGAAVLLCDTVVALICPSLVRCAQLNPFDDDPWSSLRAVFDLFG